MSAVVKKTLADKTELNEIIPSETKQKHLIRFSEFKRTEI